MSPALRRLVLALGLVVGLSACSATRALFDDDEYPLGGVEIENAALYLDRAEEEMNAGQLERALDRLIAVRELQGLDPEDRLRSEDLIDRCAAALLALADQPDRGTGSLEILWEADLSPRMRAQAGIRYAERLLEEGSRISAFKQVRDVEAELPGHTERARAGAVLAAAGLDLVRDPGRYWLILRYRTRGIAALELLVLTYPLDPACPDAYLALARAYEEDERLELAIDRHELLFLYHPSSPQAVLSRAAIPRLRLDLVQRRDYDRGTLVTAREELEQWLEAFPDHPRVAEVQASRLRCLRALADNDLYLSHYYRRIGNPFGARVHAQRALDDATEAGDPGLVARATEVLDELPPAEGPAPRTPAEASAP